MERIKLACLIFALFILVVVEGVMLGVTHDFFTGRIRVVQTSYEPRVERVIFKEVPIVINQTILNNNCVRVTGSDSHQFYCDNANSSWGKPK